VKLVDRLVSAVEQGELVDVQFIVGENEDVFGANKTMLALCSEVFKRMLFSERWFPRQVGKKMKKADDEKEESAVEASDRINEHGIREIRLVEIPATAFKLFLDVLV